MATSGWRAHEALQAGGASTGPSSKRRKASRFSMGPRRCTRLADSLSSARNDLPRVADIAGAMTLEASKERPPPSMRAFTMRGRIRDNRRSRAHLLALLRGSEIRESHAQDDPRVQDAYSLRCMPQVHGAVRGALDHCEEVLAIESGSATDNPLVFTENGDVISGGNFHGAPLALALDYAAIAMTDLMSISERRIDRLINPDSNEGLPAFLARNIRECNPVS